MKNLDQLDHGPFKAFLSAAKTLNFTTAAKEAAMTQSGVSQHIAKLEEQLGTQLFKRVNKKVFLTRTGEILLDFIEKHQDETAHLFEKIHGEVGEVKGLVRYAMPHSCLFTPHFPLLLEKRQKFLKVDLDVKLCPNEEVFERLMNQQIDFGFVTEKINNSGIQHELFAAEEYILVGNNKDQVRGLTKKTLTENSFVSYPGMNILFDLWVQNHFNTRQISFESLKIAGTINSLNGAITMVEHGVGLTVVPKHCVAGPLKQKTVFEYGSGKDSPVSEIYIVTLNDVVQSKRVTTVMKAFWEMKR